MSRINNCLINAFVAVIFALLILFATEVQTGAQPAAPQCKVVSSSLNLRAGFNTNSPVTFVLHRGAILMPLARNQASNWIKVQVAGNSTQGWVSAAARYVSCTIAIRTLPVEGASVVAAQNPASSAAPPPLESGLILDFEKWGKWARTTKNWGTFTQSREQVHAGRFSGKFAYNFPAVSDNYLIYHLTSAIPGQPSALQMWVYGDGSGNFLNVWVQDATGQLWQFTFGQVKHTGWQQMLAPFDVSRGWPNQSIGNAKTAEPVYPLRFYALVVDGLDGTVSKGTIFVDDLFGVNGAITAPPPTIPTPNLPPAQASVNFRADATTLNVTQCTTLHWDAENVQAVYVDGAGVAGHGSKSVCPAQTRDYALRAVTASGDQVYTVHIDVGPPPITLPTPPQPPNNPPAQASVNFRADATTLSPTQCTTLRWDAENVREVYLDGEGVVGHSSKSVCPSQTRDYALRVVTASGDQVYTVHIDVGPPPITLPTPSQPLPPPPPAP